MRDDRRKERRGGDGAKEEDTYLVHKIHERTVSPKRHGKIVNLSPACGGKRGPATGLACALCLRVQGVFCRGVDVLKNAETVWSETRVGVIPPRPKTMQRVSKLDNHCIQAPL
jgi:hypothetical protein